MNKIELQIGAGLLLGLAALGGCNEDCHNIADAYTSSEGQIREMIHGNRREFTVQSIDDARISFYRGYYCDERLDRMSWETKKINIPTSFPFITKTVYKSDLVCERKTY